MCGSTNAIFNYRLHKKMKEWLQIQEKDYRNMKKATETKRQEFSQTPASIN